MNTHRQEIEIKLLTVSDIAQFRDLISLFHEVFEMEDGKIIDNSELLRLLNNPDFAAFVVLYNGSVAGGATAYILRPYYAQQPELFIYDVAIHTCHQRKG